MGEHIPAHDMDYDPTHEVVAMRPASCAGGHPQIPAHIEVAKLAGDAVIAADDLIALIEAGATYYMRPPPGAPAYEAYKATGFPLILQVRVCEHCHQKVLFA